MLSNKRTELNLCIFLTEHCLYLLWTHCDFYMLRAISVNSIQSNSIGRKTIISPIDAGWKITSDDIAVLRKSLIQVFNETFCQRLVAMEQVGSYWNKFNFSINYFFFSFSSERVGFV